MLKVIDLFSGCGGLSYGLIQAGFDVVLGIDNDDMALKTFKKNHKNSKTLNADLADRNIIDLINKKLNGQKIDVIVGGPPCQGFSLTGPRNFNDPRNKLYLALFDLVKKLKPRAFIIENVSGMATLYKGEIKGEIKKRFEKLGFEVETKVVCAADYGVPQMRKRLVFVGIKKEIGKFIFPEPTLSPNNYITCSEAVSDLPARESELGFEIDKYKSRPSSDYQKNMREKSRKLYNHVATNHTVKVKKVIALVPEGGNYKNLPLGIGEHRKFNEAWTRYHSSKPSRTIDTGHRNHFHYKFNRVPTIRENARLQSFPDHFIFYGNRTQQNRQVGNAVPPLLSYHIGLKLKDYLTK